MKAKLKDANGFVRFLLQHGGKDQSHRRNLLAVAGMLIWSSLGRHVVEEAKQPEPLKTAAQKAKSKVDKMSWETIPNQKKKVNFPEINAGSGDRTAAPVNPADYPTIKPVRTASHTADQAPAGSHPRHRHGPRSPPRAGLWMSSTEEKNPADIRKAAKLAKSAELKTKPNAWPKKPKAKVAAKDAAPTAATAKGAAAWAWGAKWQA